MDYAGTAAEGELLGAGGGGEGEACARGGAVEYFFAGELDEVVFGSVV